MDPNDESHSGKADLEAVPPLWGGSEVCLVGPRRTAPDSRWDAARCEELAAGAEDPEEAEWK